MRPNATAKTRRHENARKRKVDHMLRVPTPLSDDLERIVHDTIGCCITVHRTLGPGLREIIYSKAIAIELKATDIAFEQESAFPVIYRGELLCEQRLDFVVAGKLIL